jgi:hypothetical protein
MKISAEPSMTPTVARVWQEWNPRAMSDQGARRENEIYCFETLPSVTLFHR